MAICNLTELLNEKYIGNTTHFFANLDSSSSNIVMLTLTVLYNRYYHNITSNTLTVLEAMAAHNVKTLIYSSTCATYGEPDTMPITETTPQVDTLGA